MADKTGPPDEAPPCSPTLSPWHLAQLAMLASILFFIHINRGLYIDEYTTWTTIQFNLKDLISNRLQAGHIPGYFVLMKLWVGIAGDTETMLRLPSLLCSVLTVVIFGKFTSELFSRRIASFAVLFLILHQLTIWTAQTARPYAPLLLATVTVAFGFLRWWRGQRGAAILIFAATLGGLLMHFLYMLIWIVFFVPLIAAAGNAIKTDRFKSSKAWLAGGFLAHILPVLLGLPLEMALGSEQKNFRATTFGFPVGKLLDGISQTYLGDYSFILSNSLFKYIVLTILAVHATAAFLWFRNRGKTSTSAIPLGALLLAWLLIPLVALTIVAGTGGKSVLSHERYYVIILPAFSLLGAIAADWFWQRQKLRWVALAHFPLMLLFSAGWFVQNGDGPRSFAQEIGTEHPVVGNIMPLRYEFRNKDVKFTSVHVIDEETLPQFQNLGEHGPFWFVIYNNHEDPLDEFMENPPPGWELERRAESGDMRGALFRMTQDLSVLAKDQGVRRSLSGEASRWPRVGRRTYVR